MRTRVSYPAEIKMKAIEVRLAGIPERFLTVALTQI